MIYAGAALAAILAFAGFVLLLHYLRKDNEAKGKTRAQLDAAEKIVDNVDKANAARDRLRSDPDYAGRVRKRFTRK